MCRSMWINVLSKLKHFETSRGRSFENGSFTPTSLTSANHPMLSVTGSITPVALFDTLITSPSSGVFPLFTQLLSTYFLDRILRKPVLRNVNSEPTHPVINLVLNM